MNRRNFLKQASGLLATGSAVETLVAACGSTASATPLPAPGTVPHLGLTVPRLLQWGATEQHGAPYVLQDPLGTGRTIGVEVDIAAMLAHTMGIRQERVETASMQLGQALSAGHFDVILNRWEVTADHAATDLFSQPYYRCGQQIVVREADPRFTAYTRYDRLALIHLEGFTVGVRAGSHAADILAEEPYITRKLYAPDLPFDDLAQGRIDAVLIDQPTAAYYVEGVGPGAQANPALRAIGQPFETSVYCITVSNTNPYATTLLREIDQALDLLKSNGILRHILIRWKLWNEQQADIGIQ